MGDVIKFTKGHKGETHMRNFDVSRMKQIENIVADKIKDIDFSESPYVDIVKLVEENGVEVMTAKMELDTTGRLIIDNANGIETPIIIVNTMFTNPENEDDVVFKKSRFVTAHEFGHYILHNQGNHQRVSEKRSSIHITELRELEAEYFARSILMPLDIFGGIYKMLIKLFGNDKEDLIIGTLSKMFKVTRNKIKERINDLQIVS